MEILDGYCDYSWKRELKELMSKMANLSKYQPILFDSMVMDEQKRKEFNKAQDDYYLFAAGMIYIFSRSVYVERTASVFEDLTATEKSNFYDYYVSFYSDAVRYGFSTEYIQILRELSVVSYGWYIEKILFWGFLFLTYVETQSIFIAFSFYVFLSILLDILKKEHNAPSKQMDLIIRKLYSDIIDENLNWAKEQLIEAGWLNVDAEIKVTDAP